MLRSFLPLAAAVTFVSLACNAPSQLEEPTFEAQSLSSIAFESLSRGQNFIAPDGAHQVRSAADVARFGLDASPDYVRFRGKLDFAANAYLLVVTRARQAPIRVAKVLSNGVLARVELAASGEAPIANSYELVALPGRGRDAYHRVEIGAGSVEPPPPPPPPYAPGPAFTLREASYARNQYVFVGNSTYEIASVDPSVPWDAIRRVTDGRTQIVLTGVTLQQVDREKTVTMSEADRIGDGSVFSVRKYQVIPVRLVALSSPSTRVAEFELDRKWAPEAPNFAEDTGPILLAQDGSYVQPASANYFLSNELQALSPAYAKGRLSSALCERAKIRIAATVVTFRKSIIDPVTGRGMVTLKKADLVGPLTPTLGSCQTLSPIAFVTKAYPDNDVLDAAGRKVGDLGNVYYRTLDLLPARSAVPADRTWVRLPSYVWGSEVKPAVEGSAKSTSLCRPSWQSGPLSACTYAPGFNPNG
jgi:hypothetical protein